MTLYKKREKGFTLIELLVVIAIIGTLASVVLASLSSAREKSRDVKRLAEMDQVALALELYYSDHAGDGNNAYPPNNSSPYTLPEEIVADGYLSSIPEDPTHGGTTYDYRYYRSTTAGTSNGRCPNGVPCYMLLIRPEALTGVASWCRAAGTRITTSYPDC